MQSPADTAAAMAAITAAVAAGEIMLGEAAELAKLVERLFRLVGKVAG